jgi:hypothetical protein
MDTPPVPPPAYEQVIAHKLADCGLSSRGFKIAYENELQSYEIVVDRSAGVAPEMFGCLRDAVGSEIVTFEDQHLSEQYQAFVAEAVRPQMVADAEAELARRGLLTGFPRRADFASDALFAEALEEHCGLAKGEAIRPIDHVLVFDPPSASKHDFEAFTARYSCLLAAIQLAGARSEAEFVFVGNEAAAPSD